MRSGPVELFGYPTSSQADPTLSPWCDLKNESQTSPYKKVECPHRTGCSKLYSHTETGVHCSKIRKAAPNPLIGNCSVRLTRQSGEIEDWIVCPERFLEEKVIFRDCQRFFGEGNLSVVKELRVGAEGNLDFCVLNRDDEGIVKDFVGIEVQACGTGGSGPLWDARNDYLNGTLKDQYSFSINAKDASKKILVQLLHKARQIARWRKSTVLVIQDHFLQHLRSAYAIDSHFHRQDTADFIHIHSYELAEVSGKYQLKLKEAISTDMVGLSMVLISNPSINPADLGRFNEAIGDRLEDGVFVDL